MFCRFAGCNLWSGREGDRASAQCQFCGTDFVGVDGSGGGKFDTAQALAERVSAHWPPAVAVQRLVVLVKLDFERHLLQPMDGPLQKENTLWAIEHCLRDPRWRLSLQTRKMVGIR